ncbi:hypothetical protein ACWD5R_10575 [Streptomyces sp. NPDC002514]|uniref:hypothetical protein n=1 Tax=Streptomyces sp. NPDC001270 TaxID=3364554 RepID=UPI0036CF9D98
MSREHSADPFSTFLNATNRSAASPGPDQGQSTPPLPPVASSVLRALPGTAHAQVGRVGGDLGLTTLQIADAVSLLVRLELVVVGRDGTDDTVELTAKGRALLEEL